MRPALPLALLLAAASLAGLASFAADPEPPATKDADLKALQGTWQVTSATEDGRPEKGVAGATFTFAKNKLTAREAKAEVEEVTFTLDAGKSPKQIDITRNGGTDAGIYKVEKGVLYLCLPEGRDKPRPKRFASRDALLIILKKAKK